MTITREAYDLKPLLIKQGALFLWGEHLAKWTDGGYIHHLYRFNNFYAEMCCDRHTNRLIRIATSTSPHWLVPSMGKMNFIQIDQSI